MKKVLASLFFIGIVQLQATTYSSTSVLYHWGSEFGSVPGEQSVSNGAMETITLEHSSGWDYGSNFFFIDMQNADFDSGDKNVLYAEWAPKLSLSKFLKKEQNYGFIKDIEIAAQINQGNNFQALLLGLGFAIDIPGFNFVTLDVLSRKDNYNESTYQGTLAWQSNFTLLNLPFVFEGFCDHYGVDYGSETIAQPRLLLDGGYFGVKSLQVGTELYYYRSSSSSWRNSINVLVPQVALKWAW